MKFRGLFDYTFTIHHVNNIVDSYRPMKESGLIPDEIWSELLEDAEERKSEIIERCSETIKAGPSLDGFFLADRPFSKLIEIVDGKPYFDPRKIDTYPNSGLEYITRKVSGSIFKASIRYVDNVETGEYGYVLSDEVVDGKLQLHDDINVDVHQYLNY